MKNKVMIITISISIFLIILAIISPILFTSPLTNFDFSETGQIGDTIGGIMSPILAMLAAFLTFIAFYIQYKANQIQIENLNYINKINHIERYESKLFSMLEIHRKNVYDLELTRFKNNEDKVTGQDFFSKILEIFNGLYNVFKDFPNLTDKNKTILAYLYMFYGFSLETNENLKIYYNKYFNGVIELGSGLVNYKNVTFSENYYDYGFGQILSRYFRYQYQIIKYIDNYKFSELEYEKEEIEDIKYNSAKQFRSHLTNNEQILLYYNSLTPLGEEWNKNQFIKKYKLIKNIMFPLIEGYSPVEWAKDDLKLEKSELSDFFEFYK